MRKNMKKLLITLLFTTTLLNTTASSYSISTIPSKETITAPPLSFDEEDEKGPTRF